MREGFGIPELIDGDDPEATRESLEIAEEEALRRTVPVNHDQSGRTLLAVERDRVDEPRLIAGRSEPPNLRPRGTGTYVDLLLNIRSPGNPHATAIANHHRRPNSETQGRAGRGVIPPLRCTGNSQNET